MICNWIVCRHAGSISVCKLEVGQPIKDINKRKTATTQQEQNAQGVPKTQQEQNAQGEPKTQAAINRLLLPLLP